LVRLCRTSVAGTDENPIRVSRQDLSDAGPAPEPAGANPSHL